jgi:hypothetical protein
LPKKSFWFLTEDILSKYHIFVNEEKISQNPFVLKVSNGKIYYKGAEIGKFKEIDFLPFLIKIEIRRINFEGMKNLNFERIAIKYDIFSLSSLKIEVDGKISGEGKFDFIKKKVFLKFDKNASKLNRFMRLKRTKGGYVLEKKL